MCEIQLGKGASKSGREFGRKAFSEAAKVYLEERKLHVSERTVQFEKERLVPLERFFGTGSLLPIKAEHITAYQKSRSAAAISGRTINMETGVLRRMLKRAKLWNAVAEDVGMFPERSRTVGKVLTAEQKKMLFEMAATKPDWLVAYCAGVLAVSTTCRKVELRHLRWQDVDLFDRTINIHRSKRESGRRLVPLNVDALAALARLRDRAEVLGAALSEHYIFPSCENNHVDPTKPQKTWPTAWRSLTRAAGLLGFRFHDLRHQAVTELAESGASDATIMAVAGHLSRQMMEHYSHVRMAAKRVALEHLECGLMVALPQANAIESAEAIADAFQ